MVRITLEEWQRHTASGPRQSRQSTTQNRRHQNDPPRRPTGNNLRHFQNNDENSEEEESFYFNDTENEVQNQGRSRATGAPSPVEVPSQRLPEEPRLTPSGYSRSRNQDRAPVRGVPSIPREPPRHNSQGSTVTLSERDAASRRNSQASTATIGGANDDTDMEGNGGGHSSDPNPLTDEERAAFDHLQNAARMSLAEELEQAEHLSWDNYLFGSDRGHFGTTENLGENISMIIDEIWTRTEILSVIDSGLPIKIQRASGPGVVRTALEACFEFYQAKEQLFVSASGDHQRLPPLLPWPVPLLDSQAAEYEHFGRVILTAFILTGQVPVFIDPVLLDILLVYKFEDWKTLSGWQAIAGRHLSNIDLDLHNFLRRANEQEDRPLAAIEDFDLVRRSYFQILSRADAANPANRSEILRKMVMAALMGCGEDARRVCDEPYHHILKGIDHGDFLRLVHCMTVPEFTKVARWCSRSLKNPSQLKSLMKFSFGGQADEDIAAARTVAIAKRCMDQYLQEHQSPNELQDLYQYITGSRSLLSGDPEIRILCGGRLGSVSVLSDTATGMFASSTCATTLKISQDALERPGEFSNLLEMHVKDDQGYSQV